jgi:hypothetical protein
MEVIGHLSTWHNEPRTAHPTNSRRVGTIPTLRMSSATIEPLRFISHRKVSTGKEQRRFQKHSRESLGTPKANKAFLKPTGHQHSSGMDPKRSYAENSTRLV